MSVRITTCHIVLHDQIPEILRFLTKLVNFLRASALTLLSRIQECLLGSATRTLEAFVFVLTVFWGIFRISWKEIDITDFTDRIPSSCPALLRPVSPLRYFEHDNYQFKTGDSEVNQFPGRKHWLWCIFQVFADQGLKLA